MVPAAVRSYPGKIFALESLLLTQDGVASASRFEGAGFLQVFALEEKLELALS